MSLSQVSESFTAALWFLLVWESSERARVPLHLILGDSRGLLHRITKVGGKDFKSKESSSRTPGTVEPRDAASLDSPSLAELSSFCAIPRVRLV